MQKTEEVAKQLGHDQFKSFDGWFNRWKKRHDLRYTKLYGEASEADEEAVVMWTSENVQNFLTSLLTSIPQPRQHFIFELHRILHM